MTVIKFPTHKTLPDEPQFIFSMEVYQDVDGGYIYEISENEDEERDDELLSAILYRASNQLHPMEVVIEMEIEPAND